jgi:putative lipoprotein
VRIEDVSRADAPAAVVGEQVITTEGEQVPIPFEVGYDPVDIEQRNRYSVRATIAVDGRLRYTSTTNIPVLTNGAPTEDVEVRVEQAG